MRSRSQLKAYQHESFRFALEHPFCGLFKEMSLGKTCVSLMAIDQLLSWCEISKPLIVAPRLVAETVWDQETQEWDFLSHLKISKVIGNPAQRKKALTAEADIWVISRDNLAWLVDLTGAMWPFDMVILDESTSFKSHDSLRFRKMRKALTTGKIRRMVLLTGTPVPNGLADLWAQIYLLDQGERLGSTFVGFRNRYFEGNEYTHKYTLRPGAEASIHEKIADICISMKKEDWLELKPVENITRKIELPSMRDYKQFEADSVLALETAEITAFNSGSLYMKLLQFANGAIYDENHNWHLVHDHKLDLLEEIIEGLNGEPVIIFYSFRSDVERIMARIKGITVLKKDKSDTETLARWNRGEISIFLLHPASAAHGLNLQFGGHRIIWFGVPNPLEWYQQAVARLDRQGQEFPVINMHLITAGTREEEVVRRLIEKTLTQDTFMDALRVAVPDEYKNRKAVLI